MAERFTRNCPHCDSLFQIQIDKSDGLPTVEVTTIPSSDPPSYAQVIHESKPAQYVPLSDTPRKDQLIGASIAKINERIAELEDRLDKREAIPYELEARVEKLEQSATDALDRSLVYNLRGRVERLEGRVKQIENSSQAFAPPAIEDRVKKLEQDRKLEGRAQTLERYMYGQQHTQPYDAQKLEELRQSMEAPPSDKPKELLLYEQKLDYIIETLYRQGYNSRAVLTWLAAYADIDQAHAEAQRYEDDERAGDLDRGR